jgi:hypothetical protein
MGAGGQAERFGVLGFVHGRSDQALDEWTDGYGLRAGFRSRRPQSRADAEAGADGRSPGGVPASRRDRATPFVGADRERTTSRGRPVEHGAGSAQARARQRRLSSEYRAPDCGPACGSGRFLIGGSSGRPW